MSARIVFLLFVIAGFFASCASDQANKSDAAPEKENRTPDQEHATKNMYIDVHHLGAGKVTAKDVAAAHQKDLATQAKYGVTFMKYWVDEVNGDVYCLSSSADTSAIRKTHEEAHGLLPDDIHMVTAGQEEGITGTNSLFLDVHEMGAGNVTAQAVADAHKKDLAVQEKHGVHLINYWVDEKKGTVMCLAQAPHPDSLINTHKEAHGLIPVSVSKVEQGQ